MKPEIKRESDKVWIEGIKGWSSSEKVSSVHAAFEAILKALGEDIAYEYLVGLSGLAFRMQLSRDFCPSSPHPACGYKCAGRAIRLCPYKIQEYGIDQSRKENPPDISEVIVRSIDRGIPVTTGEEEDGLIIGYQNDSNEFICLHPWREKGKKPFVVQSLAEICWGISVVTDQKTEPVEHRPLIIDSLKQAVKMAKTKRADNYYQGFNAWEQYIKELKKLDQFWKKITHVTMLGNAWIFESLVQNREVAAKYLHLIEDQFDEIVREHLRNAAALYHQMAEKILKDGKAPAVIAPYPDSLKDSKKWTKEMRAEQIKRLEAAWPLEVQAIDEIDKALAIIDA